MTWKRTSRPNSYSTRYESGDYTIIGRETAFHSARVFDVKFKGNFIDLAWTLRVAKEIAADHAEFLASELAK